MSDFDFRRIGLNSPAFAQVVELMTVAFGMPMNRAALAGSLGALEGLEPLIVGAYDGEKLIATNSFIRHPVILASGQRSLAYQSCHSATDPAYQGQGLFRQVIHYGLEQARLDGAACMIGYPNENSRPIFVKKMGFLETPSVGGRRLALPIRIGRAQFERAHAAQQGMRFDVQAEFERKKMQHGDEMRKFTAGRAVLWGRSRRRGPLRVFDIGAIECDSHEECQALFKQLPTILGAHLFINVVAVKGSFLSHLLHMDTQITPPHILLPLNAPETQVNFGAGIRDYF